MFSQSIRNLLSLTLWAALAAGVAFVGAATVFGNFMAVVSALELQGYEKKLACDDELVGPLLCSVAPNATLAHFTAFALSAGLAALLFIACHTLFHLYACFEDRRLYLRSGDAQSAATLARDARVHLLFLAILLAPIIWAGIWDIELFKYRSMAGVLDTDLPAQAAGSILYWNAIPSGLQPLAAVQIALNSGPFGYVGITAGTAFLFEIVIYKLAQKWAQLCAPLDNLLARPAAEVNPMFYGYDEAGQPVYSPEQPVAYDTKGQPLVNPAAAGVGNQGDPRDPLVDYPIQAGKDAAVPVHEQPAVTGDTAHPGNQENNEVQDQGDERLSVIGSKEGEQVTLHEARRNPKRYYVDETARKIWARDYWTLLHQEPVYQQDKEAA
jgi:hypothetical protein